MPATYAHRKFGEDIAAALGERFPETVRARSAFALGLHGPDPLFYYKPLKKNAVRARGDLLHEESAAAFFGAARAVYLARRKLPYPSERAEGRGVSIPPAENLNEKDLLTTQVFLYLENPPIVRGFSRGLCR